MTRHFDDWSAPFPVRTLRYLREELAEVERKIADTRRNYVALLVERDVLERAIAENERYLRELDEKGDGVD